MVYRKGDEKANIEVVKTYYKFTIFFLPLCHFMIFYDFIEKIPKFLMKY